MAGPSAVGKTTLLKQMRRGRLPQLAARLDVGDPGRWQYTTGLRNAPPASGRAVLLDYDALTSYCLRRPYEEDEVLCIVGRAERLSFATVWTPPERLLRQFLADDLRREHPWGYKAVKRVGYLVPRALKRPWAARIMTAMLESSLKERLLGSHRGHFAELFSSFYNRPEKIVDLYRCWFRFCDRHATRTDRNLIIEYYDELSFLSREEWETTVRVYSAPEARRPLHRT